MSLEPQTAGLPLVHVHPRPIKVNPFMVISLLVFLVIELAGILWATPPANPPVGSKS